MEFENQNIRKMPKVSICVVTYNQEKYIRQCLQSIVAQETNFDFEVIVSDDCSTDATRAIVLEFAARYPDEIKTFFLEENIGVFKNYIYAHNQAVGEYVAHIDGDDMALPGKLQAQVDYLDAHHDCTAVWHRMNLFNDEGTLNKPNLPDVSMFEEGKVFLTDVLKFGSIGYHSALMYRASARRTRQAEGETLDYYYTVEILMSGYGKYLEKILGRYRHNINAGISKKRCGSKVVTRVYTEHLNRYLSLFPKFRRDIFINSLIYFLVELKNRRTSARFFFVLAIRTWSYVAPGEFISHLKRFRRINAGV